MAKVVVVAKIVVEYVMMFVLWDMEMGLRLRLGLRSREVTARPLISIYFVENKLPSNFVATS